MPQAYVCHDSLMCVAWLNHVRGMTHTTSCITHSYLLYDYFVCGITHSYIHTHTCIMNQLCRKYKWVTPHIGHFVSRTWLSRAKHERACMCVCLCVYALPAERWAYFCVLCRLLRWSAASSACIHEYKWVMSPSQTSARHNTHTSSSSLAHSLALPIFSLSLRHTHTHSLSHAYSNAIEWCHTCEAAMTSISHNLENANGRRHF